MNYLCTSMFVIFLAACSSAPSEADIQTAIAQTQAAQPTNTRIPSMTQIEVAACVPRDTRQEIGRVISVVDGDTIEVRIEEEVDYRVRYIGIDTLEFNEPNGEKATQKNQELVAGQWVTLVKDVSETDQYYRLLRYVIVGDIFVNYEMVRTGYAAAVTYPPMLLVKALLLKHKIMHEARV